jgi:hypothetical protein
VKRQDERSILCDVEVLRIDIDALCFELCNFVAEMPGVKHDAIADHRQCAAHNSRWQERKLVGFIANNQRMPGIVPALKAHHHIGAAGEPVDNLALAFIAPLGTNYGHVCHGVSLSRLGRPCRPRGCACRSGLLRYRFR